MGQDEVANKTSFGSELGPSQDFLCSSELLCKKGRDLYAKSASLGVEK